MTPLTSRTPSAARRATRPLAWWFRVVGAIYVGLGVTFLPPINAGRIDLLVPGFDGGPTATSGFVDYLLMFGLEEIVLGCFLLFASFRPRWWQPLVWLLVALSAVRGVGHDLYMIASGYSVLTNTAFALLHLTVITTGIVFLRRFLSASGSAMRAADRENAPEPGLLPR